ncbi:AraC family transcriptional regulator [Gilvimarinus gilvus]|nr:helix-turn-helix domain-containing protein [Gilvimarinus sp. SDUM040013]
MLGLNYALFTLQASLGGLVFSGLWPNGALVRAELAMFLGPALYAYFVSVLRPGKRLSPWHLAPALAMAVTLLAKWWAIVDFAITASFIGYWLATLWQLKRTQHSTSAVPSVAFRWLWVLVAIMAINILLEVALNIEIRLGKPPAQSIMLYLGCAVFTLFHATTLLLMVARVPLIEWMHELKLPSSTQAISDEEKQSLFNRWQTLVEEQSLYRAEPTITLSRAARMLGVPARQLSQAVNGVYGASFSQHLNNVRVEKAKQLLLGHPNMNMTDIYLEAGFSTKSQFHREFSRVTATTPSAFRESVAAP